LKSPCLAGAFFLYLSIFITKEKMDNFDLKKYLVENKVTTNSKMMNEVEDEGISKAIKETVAVLKQEGIPFTMVSEAEAEDELDRGVGLDGDHGRKDIIKLEGRKGNVYIMEFGYGRISIDAVDIDTNYPEYWEGYGEDEWTTFSGGEMVDMLKKYFI
jgi:hypothetical protein